MKIEKRGRPRKYKQNKKNVTIRLSRLEMECIYSDFETIQEFIERAMVLYFLNGDDSNGKDLYLAMLDNQKS